MTGILGAMVGASGERKESYTLHTGTYGLDTKGCLISIEAGFDDETLTVRDCGTRDGTLSPSSFDGSTINIVGDVISSKFDLVLDGNVAQDAFDRIEINGNTYNSSSATYDYNSTYTGASTWVWTRQTALSTDTNYDMDIYY